MIKRLMFLVILSISVFEADTISDKAIKTTTLKRDATKEIVIDTVTNLIWQDDKSAKSIKKDWYKAKSYCETLTHAGFNDWYLPNINELSSIVDTTKYNPAIKEGFENITPSSYWSSSQSISHAKSAISIYFKGGASYDYLKRDNRNVRCVRIEK